MLAPRCSFACGYESSIHVRVPVRPSSSRYNLFRLEIAFPRHRYISILPPLFMAALARKCVLTRMYANSELLL